MTITVNAYARKPSSPVCSRRPKRGEVIIARHGRPISRLIAIAKDRPDRTPGRLAGLIEIGRDFDELA